MVGDVRVCRRSSTTTVERSSRPFLSSHTPTPTSSPRSSPSCSTRCSSRATTSSARARSAPRCTSYRRASSTSSPRPATSPPASPTDRTSEVPLAPCLLACSHTFLMSVRHRERKCANTVGTVLVPWAGHSSANI